MLWKLGKWVVVVVNGGSLPGLDKHESASDFQRGHAIHHILCKTPVNVMSMPCQCVVYFNRKGSFYFNHRNTLGPLAMIRLSRERRRGSIPRPSKLKARAVATRPPRALRESVSAVDASIFGPSVVYAFVDRCLLAPAYGFWSDGRTGTWFCRVMVPIVTMTSWMVVRR